ncbi:hypothetical protein CKF54_01530 [Psittacicella hinzii]|uniref:Uncharacterized protein n=1 Tax=Psittacicella hinzii TaxID=2028575 RepID=A0A3A1YA80_9GAMM|nr:hypothetical protein [Psittacicella hinzii]RIY34139.1 hypothetical protein CKF54_01530 [Psittacicella hinzii]
MFKKFFNLFNKAKDKEETKQKHKSQANNISLNEFKHLESTIEIDELNTITPQLEAEFNIFTKFLEEQKEFKLNISQALLSDAQKLTQKNLFDLIVSYSKEYQTFTSHILKQKTEVDKLDSRFLSLMASIEDVFNKKLFDKQGNIDLDSLALINFFLNDIFYKNKDSLIQDKHSLQSQDLYDILESHFSGMAPSKFYQTYVKDLYPQHLLQKLDQDIEMAIGKDNDFFDCRLPLLLLIPTVRKGTFLPLSYHEIILNFFSDRIENPKDQLHFLEMRRSVITYDLPLVELLITQYLTIKAYEYDLINQSYFIDKTNLESFLNRIKMQPIYLFAYLILARRKSKQDKIFLHEKDILILDRLSYLCDSNVDFKNLYLYLKGKGL